MIEPEKFCQNTINAESLKVLQSDNKLGCHGRIVEYLVERGKFSVWFRFNHWYIFHCILQINVHMCICYLSHAKRTSTIFKFANKLPVYYETM